VGKNTLWIPRVHTHIEVSKGYIFIDIGFHTPMGFEKK
jgi:hypothetical protein